MELDVQINPHELRAWEATINVQIPFATSLALNKTANDVQAAIRQGLVERFILRRRQYIERTIKIFSQERATKDNQRVVIRVDPASDILAKFEAGGVKHARGGRLAVPAEGLSVTRAQVIPQRLRPKGLQLRLHRTAAGKVQFKGLLRTFLIERSTFNSGIVQRVGRGRGSRLRILYWFQRGVSLPPDLRFERTGRRVVSERFETNFGEAMARAVATAR